MTPAGCTLAWEAWGELLHPCPSSWPEARIFPKHNCQWAGFQVGWEPPSKQVLGRHSNLWLISTRNHDSISEPRSSSHSSTPEREGRESSAI